MSDKVEVLLARVLQELSDMHAELGDLRIVVDAISNGPMAPESDDYDPICRFDPAGWKGESCKGRKMSDCTIVFLEAFAVALLSIASKEDVEKKLYKGGPASRLTRQNAARARRWALRKRLGWEPEEAPAAAGFGTSESAPFGGSQAAPFGGAPAFGAQPAWGTSEPNVDPKTAPRDDSGNEEDEDDDLPF